MKLVDCYGIRVFDNHEYDGIHFTLKIGEPYEYQIEIKLMLSQVEDFTKQMVDFYNAAKEVAADYQLEDLQYDFSIKER